MADMVSTRDGFGNALLETAEDREDFVVFDADLAKSTRGGWFRDEHPDRWFNMGISEQDMFATAAGVADTGRPVFANTFAIFSQRGFEQIRQQIARPNQNVTVVGSHAGTITGLDGTSAQAIEDISAYRGLPNMSVVSPADAEEAKHFVELLPDTDGPTYLRLVRESIPVLYDDHDCETDLGKGDVLEGGDDVSIIAHGAAVKEALEAADILADEDVSAQVINMSSIKPLDEDLVLDAAEQTGAVVTVEDHNVIGGLGSAVAEVLSEQRPTKMKRVGVDDEFGKTGSGEELYDYFGLSAEHVAEHATDLL